MSQQGHIRKPLAERMRPKKPEDFFGQEHLIGEGKLLTSFYESGVLPSMILWGPPGVGKTTMARMLSGTTESLYFALSAISAGVKQVREVIETARKAGHAVLFIDEIHRFNKAQQDSLLGAIEEGSITLIGATTENPSFEVIHALLSRCQVLVLNPLDAVALRNVLDRALRDDEVYSDQEINLEQCDELFKASGGDARRLLNLLELVLIQYPDRPLTIDNAMVAEVAQKRMSHYDKDGEQHYDLASAFIKSMRGSDPNASLYYLARMIESGEDPKFIARRMLILASEDIGNANPTALVLATSCFHAVSMTGYPEASIVLAQTVSYLASSAKSNASYLGLRKALALVQKTGDLQIPLSLRNSPTALMKDMGYGKDYSYAHQHDGNFVHMEFMPDQISGTKLYEPGENSREEQIRNRLRALWKEKYGY